MSSKSKHKGFTVVCDEESGRIIDMPPVGDDNQGITTEEDNFQPGKNNKHHLSNSGTKRPGCRK